MVPKQEVTEDDGPGEYDLVIRLNRRQKLGKQHKSLLFNEKQLAANQRDELF